MRSPGPRTPRATCAAVSSRAPLPSGLGLNVRRRPDTHAGRSSPRPVRAGRLVAFRDDLRVGVRSPPPKPTSAAGHLQSARPGTESNSVGCQGHTPGVSIPLAIRMQTRRPTRSHLGPGFQRPRGLGARIDGRHERCTVSRGLSGLARRLRWLAAFIECSQAPSIRRASSRPDLGDFRALVWRAMWDGWRGRRGHRVTITPIRCRQTARLAAPMGESARDALVAENMFLETPQRRPRIQWNQDYTVRAFSCTVVVDGASEHHA